MQMTLDTIPQITSDILEKISKLESSIATVITLSGELGAGKTTLTQSIAKALGIKENIISPTFVIMKSYELSNQKFKKLIHIDAYRLEKSDELLKLGFSEIVSDKDNLILIEWPENVPECIPKNAFHIKLTHDTKETRTIEF